MCNTGHSTLSVVHLFVSRHVVIWLASLLQKDADEKLETVQAFPTRSGHHHRIPGGRSPKAVLGGLHHEYWLEQAAA